MTEKECRHGLWFRHDGIVKHSEDVACAEARERLRSRYGFPVCDVIVEIVERALTTQIGRGENSGRSLANDHVVRTLVRAFALESGAEKTARVTVPIDPGSNREKLRATAFLQDKKSLEVLGTTAGPLR